MRKLEEKHLIQLEKQFVIHFGGEAKGHLLEDEEGQYIELYTSVIALNDFDMIYNLPQFYRYLDVPVYFRWGKILIDEHMQRLAEKGVV